MRPSGNSQMDKIKSLKNILLERCVVNFDKIFLEVNQKKKKAVKKEICLTRSLFEFIQSKAIEISWPIPHEHLKVCLSNREALNWMNINLSYGLLCEEDLLRMKSDFPVKQLSFRTRRITIPMMNFIEKIAHNIEILEIMNPLLRSERKEFFYGNNFHRLEPIRFPKLKKLFIDTGPLAPNFLQRFDLTSCSESLKQLSVNHLLGHSFHFKNSFCLFVETFKCLKNLQILSLTGAYTYSELLNVIVHLKNLKTLDIPYISYRNPNKIRTLESLPQLTRIQMPENHVKNELQYLKDRKLDYVGSFGRIPSNLTHLSKKIGSIYYVGMERKFNMLQNSSNLTFYLNIIRLTFTKFLNLEKYYYEPQQKITASQLRKYEQLILVCIRWAYNNMAELHRSVRYVDRVLDQFENDWSQTFLIKLANLVVNSARHAKKTRKLYQMWFIDLMKSPRLKNTMLDFIILNPNSAMAKMYLKHLITPAALKIEEITGRRNLFVRKINFINTFEVTSLEYNLL